jgi:hypothetical protein
MQILKTNTCELRKLKTRIGTNSWGTPQCEVCRKKFHNGLTRYEWRMSPPLIESTWVRSTFWNTSCRACLQITLKSWHHSLDEMYEAL